MVSVYPERRFNSNLHSIITLFEPTPTDDFEINSRAGVEILLVLLWVEGKLH